MKYSIVYDTIEGMWVVYSYYTEGEAFIGSTKKQCTQFIKQDSQKIGLNFLEKCNKKAHKSIKRIINATNMIEVECAINDAMMDTFGIRNFGLMKIAMREGSEYSKLRVVYGCDCYGGNFELLKAVRLSNRGLYGNLVKQYLMSFIPQRMSNCTMFHKMEQSIAA